MEQQRTIITCNQWRFPTRLATMKTCDCRQWNQTLTIQFIFCSIVVTICSVLVAIFLAFIRFKCHYKMFGINNQQSNRLSARQVLPNKKDILKIQLLFSSPGNCGKMFISRGSSNWRGFNMDAACISTSNGFTPI